MLIDKCDKTYVVRLTVKCRYGKVQCSCCNMGGNAHHVDRITKLDLQEVFECEQN